MARYFRRGISKLRFAPSIADLDTPTRAEITASVDLTVDVASISGLKLKNAPITTPDLLTTFDPQINGVDTVDDSTVMFYDQDDADTIRTALAKGTDGYLLLMPYGDVPTDRMEVWPARSTGVNDEWSMDATAAKFEVGFAITELPEQNAVVPAV